MLRRVRILNLDQKGRNDWRDTGNGYRYEICEGFTRRPCENPHNDTEPVKPWTGYADGQPWNFPTDVADWEARLLFANMLIYPDHREHWNVATPKRHRLPKPFRSLGEMDYLTKEAIAAREFAFLRATRRLPAPMIAAVKDVLDRKRNQRGAARWHGVSEEALRQNVGRVAARMKIFLANCHTPENSLR